MTLHKSIELFIQLYTYVKLTHEQVQQLISQGCCPPGHHSSPPLFP